MYKIWCNLQSQQTIHHFNINVSCIKWKCCGWCWVQLWKHLMLYVKMMKIVALTINCNECEGSVRKIWSHFLSFLFATPSLLPGSFQIFIRCHSLSSPAHRQISLIHWAPCCPSEPNRHLLLYKWIGCLCALISALTPPLHLHLTPGGELQYLPSPSHHQLLDSGVSSLSTFPLRASFPEDSALESNCYFPCYHP